MSNVWCHVPSGLLFCVVLTLHQSDALAAASQAQPAPVYIVHATVVDTVAGTALPDRTVMIAGDRIASVTPGQDAAPTLNAHVIDARGKYLIPGLWDMHVHVFLRDAEAAGLVFMPETMYFRLFIANGVTGFRDMAGTRTGEELASLRRAGSDGRSLVPKFIATGPIVDGPKPIWPFSLTAATAADGRAAVDTIKAAGFDFVKVYNFLPRDAYFGLASEAHRQDFPFVGHVPDGVTALEASNAGQRSIEHLTGILSACSSREGEFAAMWREALEKGEPYGAVALKIRRLLLPSYDSAKAAVLFETFARNQTWQVPTLTVRRSFAHLDVSVFKNDERLAYISAEVRKSWEPEADFRLNAQTADDWKLGKEIYEKNLEIVREMHRRGVLLMAGTDLGNQYIFPGFSLHDELGLLVKAGLTPLDALRAATFNPARFMGREADFGSVAPGKMADLVLLDASPLDDIENIRRIHAVVLSGTYFDRRRLDAMLADAKVDAKGDE